MKIIAFILLGFVAIFSDAQTLTREGLYGITRGGGSRQYSSSSNENLQRAQLAAGSIILREVGDKSYNCLQAPGWETIPGDFSMGFLFFARVLEIRTNGVICEITESDPLQGFYNTEGDIFIENYIGRAQPVLDKNLPDCRAMRLGNTNIDGIPMKLFDCGVPYVPPPPTAEQVKADQEQARIAREKAAAKKAIDDINLLAWQQQEATNGNAAQQYNLGVRYLTGDLVAKDPRQAREWFAKAAAQGDPDAIAALTNSPSK